ncbi:MAG TPA: ABC transporter permease [Acidimicrobiales bacterium]|jgi:branched-chain amino acid transport system permease protein|nr:ABC transporter permease [Acidimicrobiales bacterium]
MHEFIIFTIGGLATASIYAVTASGLTLTYATTGIFNWSHGAIGMVAAFAYWQMHVGWGWSPLLCFAVCLFILAPVLGIALEAGVMRRLDGTSEAAKLVVTLALAFGMIGIVQWIWNPATYRALPPLFAGDTLVLGSVRISYNDVVVLAVALVVAVGLRVLLYRTRLGVTMRASVDDRSLTTLNGASSVRSAQSAWIIGCMLAALAGILVAPTVSLSATSLTLLIVDAYAASVIGRMRSIPMTFVGAIVLGLAVSYSVAYLPQNAYIQGFEGAVPALVLFIALLVLPQSRLRGHRLLRSRELALVPSWRGTGIFGVGVVVSAVVIATVVSSSDLFAINRVWGLAIIGLSLVPVVGFAGRLSLCQMTFAGIGAVVVGHLGGGANPLTLFAAAGVCAVAGVLVALPTLRLSGIYFALSTAAFATAMDAWVFPLPAFDLFGHQFAPFGTGSLTFAPFRVGGFVASSKELQFVIGSLIFMALAALVVLLRRSNFGSQLFAFKDSPAASATLGMNTRILPIAVFAFSAAIAGVGGAVYGQSLGSVAPDMYAFFTGLSVLLTMVVLGLGSLGAGVGTGVFLGGPTLTNLFPSLLQLQSVLVGGAAVGVGTSPNGLIPSGFRPLWASTFRRRRLLAGILTCLLGLWGLRLGGVIGNWTMVWAMLAVVVAGSVVPYVVDYRSGEAQPAFGLRPPSGRRGDTPISPKPQALPSLAVRLGTVPPSTVESGSHGT